MSALITAFVSPRCTGEPFGGVVALIQLFKAMNVRSIVQTVSFRFPCIPSIEVVFSFLLRKPQSIVALMGRNRSLSYLSVGLDQGTPVFAVQDGMHFCCGDIDLSSNQCSVSTRGSTTPFRVTTGKVIYNRTTGSTSPNNMDVITVNLSSSTQVTVTVPSTTAPRTITTISSKPLAYANPPPSSKKSTKVGLGVGVPLGLASLGILGLLWRQRTRELGARTEARTWKEKYDELKKEKRGDATGVEGQMHELHESWRPNEIAGRPIYEMDGNVQ